MCAYRVQHWLPILLVIGLGLNGVVMAERAETPYENAARGFTIKYPKKWQMMQGQGDLVVRFVSPTGVPVTVYQTDLPANFGFHAYFRLEVVGFKKSRKDFKVIENGRAPIAGHDAKKYTYSFTHKGKTLHCVTYYLSTAKKGGGAHVYKIECLAEKKEFSRNKRTFSSIASSFKFKKRK